MDVTKSKRIEEALRRSEQNFRDSIENSPSSIRILDKDGKTLYANRALLDTWGYSSVEELVAVPKEQRYTPQSYAEHMERLGKRKQGEPAPTTYEISIVRSDGEVRIVSVSRGELLWNGEKQFQLVYQDITARRKAEEALRQSENKYRTLVDNASDAIIVAQDDRVKFFNDKALEISGYSREEIESVPFWNLIHPEDLQKAAERYLEGLSDRAVTQFYDLRFIHKTGDLRWVDVAVAPITWEGKPAAMAFVADVTERRRAEEALRRSEQNFRDSIENSPLGIRILDKDGKTLYANRALLDMWGYSSLEEMEAVSEKRRYTPKAYAGHLERFEKRKQEEFGHLSYETSIVRSDGQVRHVSASRGDLLWGGEECFQVVYQDITEQKRLQEALVKSEERYRTVLEQMEEAYYETDIAGKFTFCNDAMCRQLGYSREELVGMSFKDITPPEDVKRVFGFYNQVYRTGEPFTSVPIERVRKDGRRISVESSIFSLRDNSGEIIGFRGLAADVTERRQFEQKLAEMATHDALTGLPNRALLSDRFTVALELSRRSRTRLAIMMLDLDRFKAVNDSMGHDVGDKLLKAVGKRLEATVRKSDTVVRIGGDEFVLLLPQIPHVEEAAKFAQRILDAFREPFVFNGYRPYVTTSIGIAIYPEGGEDIEGLLKSADTAMYRAKEQGRDIYRFFDANEDMSSLVAEVGVRA